MNLALFDLDNTLLAGDSDFEWGQFLIEKGVVDPVVQDTQNRRFFNDYKAGTLDIDAFLAFQLAPLAAHPRHLLDAWHAEFMDRKIRPLISHRARELIQQHEDDLCAIVTATNAFVTGPIARELDIPHLIATIPAQMQGQFTGRPRGTPSFKEGKIIRVDAWLESLGLHWGNFKTSHFYSDSHNDLPLLEKVTHPVAVDPDEKLAKTAKERGWPIITLR